MNKEKTFSEKLGERYLLIVREEENLAEVGTWNFNIGKALLLALGLFFVSFFLGFVSSQSSLGQLLGGRKSDSEINQKIIELSLSLDSLEQKLEDKDQFIRSIQAVVSGDSSVLMNTGLELNPVQGGSKKQNEIRKDDISLIESKFRKAYQSQHGASEQNFSMVSHVDQDFFPVSPINGIVSESFDPKNNHYGVDIVATKDEPVKSIADGTVVFANWTLNEGYVLMIQHSGDFISTYKHNAQVLKEVGSYVGAGEIIAIVGNTGELTTGPHLHFELWSKGLPVDPLDFVSV